MTDERLALAASFPEISVEEWKKSLNKVLKGASIEEKMFVNTYEGINIQPLYTKEDWKAEGNPSGFPGSAPFTRGGAAIGSVTDGWDVRQIHSDADISIANKAILEDLERGVTSIILQLDDAALAGLDAGNPKASDLAGRNGVMVSSVADLDMLLDGVLLDLAGISLEAGAQSTSAAAILAALWVKRGVSSEQAFGAFNADPLGVLAAKGALPNGIGESLDDMASLAKATATTYPNVTAVKVDTSAYYGAGASETQDLAVALATGVTYLRAMIKAGLTVDQAAPQIVFSFANSANVFLGIAKLRSARLLWAQVVKASGGSEEACAMNLHAKTSERALSKRDPWVNILRTTATCFVGAVGGANSITVLPFDHHCYGQADSFARRIARNTQVVLQEESFLNKVVDPVGGSWYVESLTEEFSSKAWSIFQEIERRGGMTTVILTGWIQDQIAATWRARVKNIATRKDPITGVSEFPNINEEDIKSAEPDYDSLIMKAAERLSTCQRKTGWSVEDDANNFAALRQGMLEGETIGTIAHATKLKHDAEIKVSSLPAHRLAEDFEKLRDAADEFKRAKGKFPTIFSANIGAAVNHTSQATFAKNFFEAGGIEVITNDGFATASGAVQAFHVSGADVAVICGSDKQVGEIGIDLALGLKRAGAKKVYLVAKGKAIYVDAVIDMDSDILSILQNLHKVLGV
ncbi:methylmalonyl-CoA mutase family protein [Amphritea sp. HPY]|uniref:methylmalonyl-CoA mutase family protein n=1 Tax=Amphritea sp. HPY TaxID=3421652 RepID=UPI003D7C6A84